MRRFLVTDDMGNPVYVDPAFDADRSTLLCLPFATTQDLMQVRCGCRERAPPMISARLQLPPRAWSVPCVAPTQNSFSELFTAVYCDDNTLFVFTHCDNLLFLVVTDEGDSVPFLKRQLQLVYELLQFKLGPKPDVRATPRGAGPS